MTVNESLQETKIHDIQDQTEEESMDLPALTEVSEEPGSESSWRFHDYSDEPRLRDLPFRLVNLPRLLLLALIRFYQLTFSRGLPANTCRFYPSCSHYGYQAVYKHGAMKGSILAAWRVLRCNPFNRGGYDPVP